MCAPSPPPAPNPAEVSAAQTQSNAETARLMAQLNRVNTTTPWGSLNFTNTGDTWNADVSLSPDQQKLLTMQNTSALGRNEVANALMGQISGSYAKPLDVSGLPQTQTSLQMPDNLPQLSSGVRGGPIQTGVPSTTGQYQSTPGQLGPIQTSLPGGLGNYTTSVKTPAVGFTSQVNTPGASSTFQTENLPQLTQDFSADRTKVEEALFSRINPQLQRDRSGLESRLANQGITQGSEAYNREIELANQAANDARMQAILAGGQEQSRLAGLTSDVRQQLFGEGLTRGNFANQAAAQNFGQGLANAQLMNSLRGQLFGEGVTNANMANAGRQQQFAEQLAGGQFANQAQAQGAAQQFQGADLANTVADRQFSQGLASGQFANQAQGQGFGQGLASAQLGNAANAQQFGQDFQVAGTNANLSNAARQQMLQELLMRRNEPLNAYSALQSGTQVQMPNFPGVPQTSVAPTNTAQNAFNAYQGAMSGYGTQTGANNSMLQGMASLGAMLYMASDRRLKKNIKRIGTHSNGLSVYSYTYLWGTPSIGFMADEVLEFMPEAVGRLGEYLTVNYAMLEA